MPVPAAPSPSFLAPALLAVFALLAVKPLGWLRPGGAACALGLGVVAYFAFGAAGLAALFAPFTVATLLGRLPGTAREAPRSWRQVAANGLVPLAGAVLATFGAREVGFSFFLGGLAFLGSDTSATEIGVRFGGVARHVLNRRPLPRGESGGTTLLGTAAAAAGALLAPAALLVAGVLAPGPVGLAAMAGFGGQVADSVFGATIQRPRGPLDNDAVNLLGSLVAGGLAWVLLALG